jgi:hypothetical protein
MTMPHDSARLLAGLSFLVLTSLSAPARAQFANPSATTIGVKGGVASTTLEFTGDGTAFERVTGISRCSPSSA